MLSFGNIKQILRVGKDVGFGKEKVRSVLNGTLFDSADRGFLKMLSASMVETKNRKGLFNAIEKRSLPPVELPRLIGFFERFKELKGRIQEDISQEDIEFIRFVTEYFGDWFYRGDWLDVPEQIDEKTFAFFSVPAGILNLLAKILEIPDYKSGINEINKSKMLDEINAADKFFRSDYYINVLLAVYKNSESTETQVHLADFWFNNKRQISEAFIKSRNFVLKELMNSRKPENIFYFMKTCLVAANMLRIQQIKIGDKKLFMPDLNALSTPNEYLIYDFSSGQNPKWNSMHYPTHKILFAMVFVIYLRNKKENSNMI